MKPHAVPDVLAYLAGAWYVERTAQDLTNGAAGRFTGTTVFGPLGGGADHGSIDECAGHGLLHHESGTFVWQGTPRPAERILRYLPGERAGTAHVEFSDGRPFHDLDLHSGSYVAHHPCVADAYRGEFTVLGPDRWQTHWRVTGPAKDVLLVTDYIRRPGTTTAPRTTTAGSPRH